MERLLRTRIRHWQGHGDISRSLINARRQGKSEKPDRSPIRSDHERFLTDIQNTFLLIIRPLTCLTALIFWCLVEGMNGQRPAPSLATTGLHQTKSGSRTARLRDAVIPSLVLLGPETHTIPLAGNFWLVFGGVGCLTQPYIRLL
ncbi:hypothetical protein V8F20_008727 [Naviculisporaceae sp. PSN 640]